MPSPISSLWPKPPDQARRLHLSALALERPIAPVAAALQVRCSAWRGAQR
jgi:hypothetical protein